MSALFNCLKDTGRAMGKMVPFVGLLQMCLLIGSSSVHGQTIVQSKGIAKVYNTFPEAVTNSISGDTIYLPGIQYTFSDVIIDKRLIIYGTGHYQDSSKVTGVSQLNGNIRFVANSDSSFITGVYLNGKLYIGSTTDDLTIKKIKITRNRIGTITFSSPKDTSKAQQTIITENVMSYLYGGNVDGLTLAKNLIQEQIFFIRNGLIINNNFLTNTYDALNNLSNCYFANNIILDSNIDFAGKSVKNCLFENNLFVASLTFPNNSNDGVNNIFGQTFPGIFKSVGFNAFSYAHNYNLANGSPGANAGKDGFDIGIYGTSLPYKAGAIPNNPHIVSKDIPYQLDSNGNLLIKIKVSSQDH